MDAADVRGALRKCRKLQTAAGPGRYNHGQLAGDRYASRARSEGAAYDTAGGSALSGADSSRKTSFGLTTFDFAKRQGNDGLVKILMEARIREESPASSIPRPKPARSIRAAVERAIPPLQRCDVAFLERAGCVSCHNNSLTAMTVAEARSRGHRHGWLESAEPASTEDHVFQIPGLKWGSGSRETIRTAASRLLALQRSDGG